MLLPSQLKEAHVQTHFGPLHPIKVFESTSSGKVPSYWAEEETSTYSSCQKGTFNSMKEIDKINNSG